MITRTHNSYHLGDNLVHLNFLRKVAIANPERAFVHAAQWQYLKQLQDVIADVPNVELKDFNYTTPSDSINAWRGDKQFWYSHPDRNDFVKFHVEAWFPFLSDRMGVANPIKCAKDMLFDYPAIQEPVFTKSWTEGEILVVNSPPGSGQFRNYDEGAFDPIITRMVEKGLQVVSTWPAKGLSVTQIGNLSLACHTILMVSTGPSWPTFNIWNQESVKHRIILLEPERVSLSPNTLHCTSIEQAETALVAYGLL